MPEAVAALAAAALAEDHFRVQAFCEMGEHVALQPPLTIEARLLRVR